LSDLHRLMELPTRLINNAASCGAGWGGASVVRRHSGASRSPEPLSFRLDVSGGAIQ
jgi:hypothetical protein